MKIILTLLLSLSLITPQDNSAIVADWTGEIEVPQQNVKLTIIFHITETDGVLAATMDSPQQNAFGFKMDEVTFSEGKLTMKINQFAGVYEGELKDGKIEGKWSQGGQGIDLVLTKVKKS